MNVVLMGPPGAGKGTQAKFISESAQIPHISTGDMLREEMASGSKLGARVKEIVNAGKLVDDALMIDIVRERLSREDVKKGFILDGFPRTLAQSEKLDEMLVSMEKRIDYVLYVNVPEEVIVERLSSRRVCPKCGKSYNLISNPPREDDKCDDCGTVIVARDDDNPETIRNRYRIYESSTEPVIEYYRNRNVLFTVDGTLPVEKVNDMVLNITGGKR